MPKFVSEAHRKHWIASQRRSRAKRANGDDMLTKGAELGRRGPTQPPIPPRTSDKPNGKFDQMLSVLRVQRVTAEQQVTHLDNAIRALEALK